MKIKGRHNYKAGTRDEAGSPPYAVVPLFKAIEKYRHHIGLTRKQFVILEPAIGLIKTHPGLKDGFKALGYTVFGLAREDFTAADFVDINYRSYAEYGNGISMIATNPPFSVGLKRGFVVQCSKIRSEFGIPFCLLMTATTLVEKRNGLSLRSCSVHVPRGRINYNMPSKGWGTVEKPTKATFETMWYAMGLSTPYSIWYDNFDMSDHFNALNKFDLYIEEVVKQ